MILKPQDPIETMGEKTYGSLPMISQDSLELASRHRFVLGTCEVVYKFIKSANFLILLIGLGFWKRRAEGFTSADKYLLYIFIALFVMSIFYARQVYYFSTRHGLTLVLPCLFLAGQGLILLAENLFQRINRITPGWAVIKKYSLHLTGLFLVVVFIVQGISFRKPEKFAQKEIGVWLKENGYQGSLIMGPKKFLRVAFYADGTFLEMPNSLEKVLDFMHRNDVRIIVVDACAVEQDYPDFHARYSQAGLFPLNGPRGTKGKCAIQLYGVDRGGSASKRQ